jgi:hypothetical protein
LVVLTLALLIKSIYKCVSALIHLSMSTEKEILSLLPC